MIELLGGWGYFNLGDEAILAGYIESVAEIGPIAVTSVDPRQTSRAQLDPSIDVRSEYRLRRSGFAQPLLCGGGYLNGNWTPEVQLKLGRLNYLTAKNELVAHGLELRKLERQPARSLASRLFSGSALAVRDEESKRLADAIGLPPAVVLPDSISLLSPFVEKYLDPAGVSKGKVLLNLLDMSARPDAKESEIDMSEWRHFCERLIEALGTRAMGLVVGGGDRAFMNTLPDMPLVEPQTVSGLLSLIAEADAILSVRMHPALLGSILHTPTISVPYTGKVRPTLTAIGIEHLLLDQLDVDAVLERLTKIEDSSANWATANRRNKVWLDGALTSSKDGQKK